MCSFPRIGCPNFTVPAFNITIPSLDNPVTLSHFFPDQAVGQINRYLAIEQNVRHRRGRKPACNIPIFKVLFSVRMNVRLFLISFNSKS